MGSRHEADVSKRIGDKVVAAAHQEYNKQDILAEAKYRLMLGEEMCIRDSDFHILIGLCDQGIHTFFQIFCRIINRYNNTYFIIFFTVHPDYVSGYILILQQVIKILLYLTHYISSVKFLHFIPIADKFL